MNIGDKFRFNEPNRARYWMDFSTWEGLPGDRIFTIDDMLNDYTVSMTARGYGILHASPSEYGSGGIFISMVQVNKYAKKVIDVKTFIKIPRLSC